MFAPPIAKTPSQGAKTNGSIHGRASKDRSTSENGPAPEVDFRDEPFSDLAPSAPRDFSNIPIYAPGNSLAFTPPLGGVLQRKLAIGRTDDPLEAEADRVADEVMRMPEPRVAAAPPQLSRKCAACEKEDEEEKTPKLQMKPAAATQPRTHEAPAIVHEVLRSPGQPLDAKTRAFFEPRFGRDFGDVRIHDDSAAAASAHAVRASAYNVGSDIVFGGGRYQPQSAAGRRLLAHELSHTVQQRCSGQDTVEAKENGGVGVAVESPQDKQSSPKRRAECEPTVVMRSEASSAMEERSNDEQESLRSYLSEATQANERDDYLAENQAESFTNDETLGDDGQNVQEFQLVSHNKKKTTAKSKHKSKPPENIPTATSPSEGALKALEAAKNLRDQTKPAIWFDSWGNDLRDNNLDGKIDNKPEQGLSDGSHYGKVHSAKICKSPGDTIDSCPPTDQSTIDVQYKVCIDIPIESYKAAGANVSTSRWIPTFFSQLASKPNWTVWKGSTPKLLDGDIVAASNADHQHAGIVETGLLVNSVINIPGPTAARKFLLFNPSGTNDIKTVPRVLFEGFLSIDFVARLNK